MKLKNNKAARGEFLCGNCRKYKLKSEKRKTVSIHCLECEASIAKSVMNKDKVPTHRATGDSDIRQRAADLMLEIEYKRINGNHLADYL